jgi:hypothetical protein
MNATTSHVTSWVHLCSLWCNIHFNKWMLSASMGCEHIQWRRLVSDRWGSFSWISSVVENIVNYRGNNGIIGQAMSHVLIPKLQHKWKQSFQWTLNIFSKECWKRYVSMHLHHKLSISQFSNGNCAIFFYSYFIYFMH